jgi:tetratricopeptide (TPR) repeat protein
MWRVSAALHGAGTMHRISLAARVLFLMLISLPANAQPSDNLKWCNNVGNTFSPDLSIRGCTAIIESGREPESNLAALFTNRGNAYDIKGQYDLAIKDLDQAIKLNPNFAAAFNSRGTVFGHKNQNDRAIQDYDQAIRLKPDYADAFFNRGYTYSLKGQNDRAIQDYDQAIRIKPNFALALKFRGEAKLKKGDAAGGNADIAKAQQLNQR